MSIYTELQSKMKAVRLVESSDALPQLIKKAETQELSYSQFLLSVMTYEQQRRSEKVIEKIVLAEPDATVETIIKKALKSL